MNVLAEVDAQQLVLTGRSFGALKLISMPGNDAIFCELEELLGKEDLVEIMDPQIYDVQTEIRRSQCKFDRKKEIIKGAYMKLLNEKKISHPILQEIFRRFPDLKEDLRKMFSERIKNPFKFDDELACKSWLEGQSEIQNIMIKAWEAGFLGEDPVLCDVVRSEGKRKRGDRSHKKRDKKKDLEK